MLIRKSQQEFDQMHDPKGGKGCLDRWNLLPPSFADKKIEAFATVALEVGGLVGEHRHINNAELFFFIEGQGSVLDNGQEAQVGPGDLLATEQGGSHGVRNSGQVPLKYVAVLCS